MIIRNTLKDTMESSNYKVVVTGDSGLLGGFLVKVLEEANIT